MKKVFFPLITLFFIFCFLEIGARFVFFNESLNLRVRSDHSSYRRIQWAKTRDNPESTLINWLHDFDPDLGWKYKKNLKNVDFYENKHVSTNREGYRNQFEFSTKHDKITFILGDSFTFGDEVNDNETFSYLLNENYPNKKFYNLGVSSYGYDQALLTLQKYIGLYRPKMVMLAFNFTDLERALLSFHDFSKPYFTIDDQGELMLHKEHLRTPKETLEGHPYKSFLIDLIKILYWRHHWGNEEYWKNLKTLNEKIISKISDISKRNGHVGQQYSFS